jgi:ABC-type glycerol-3-phosphate transport system substrate-binding protein
MPKPRSSRWVPLLLISLFIAACAQKATPTSPPIIEIFGVDPQVPAAHQRLEGDSRTEIVWLVPSEWPNLEYVVAEFEAENLDIWVEIKQIPASTMIQEIEEALGTGSETPDVICLDATLSAYYGHKGWLESLWNAFTFDQQQDWVRASRMSSIFNHERYSAPLTISNQLLFFNRDLFDQGHVKPPKPDKHWTWEKVMKAAEKLTLDDDEDGSPEKWGFSWETTSFAQLAVLAEQSGDPVVGTEGLIDEAMLQSNAWISPLNFFWEVYNEKKVSPRDGDSNTVEGFEDGNLAMFVGEATNIMRFADANSGSGLEFEWGVSPYPYIKKGVVADPIGGWNLGINANSKQKEAALRFVVWLSTGEGAKTLWRLSNPGLPTQKSILNEILSSSEFNTAPLSYLRVAASQAIESLSILPITPVYHEFSQISEMILWEIRNGSVPEDALSFGASLITIEVQDSEN